MRKISCQCITLSFNMTGISNIYFITISFYMKKVSTTLPCNIIIAFNMRTISNSFIAQTFSMRARSICCCAEALSVRMHSCCSIIITFCVREHSACSTASLRVREISACSTVSLRVRVSSTCRATFSMRVHSACCSSLCYSIWPCCSSKNRLYCRCS